MMKLSEFVSTTLTEIIEGVATAKKAAARYDAVIAPSSEDKNPSGGLGDTLVVYYQGHNRMLHNVRFDISVEAAKTEGTSGTVGVVLASIGIGAQGKSESQAGQTHRIQFCVPVILPADVT